MSSGFMELSEKDGDVESISSPTSRRRAKCIAKNANDEGQKTVKVVLDPSQTRIPHFVSVDVLRVSEGRPHPLSRVRKFMNRLIWWRKDDEQMRELKSEVHFEEHLMSIEDVEIKYSTNQVLGLTTEQSEAELQKNGMNCLSPPKSTPEVVKFAKHMFSGFSSLLLIASAMCLLLFVVTTAKTGNYHQQEDNLYLGVVLFLVVIVTSCFSYYQEAKSAFIMKGFLKLIPQNATAIRNGLAQEVDPRKLVVGDLVIVNSGDRIPADLRLVHADRFKVDNSTLTGESESLTRTPHNTITEPLEATNLAFFSTFAVEGQCKGIVVRTGDNTMMGRIASLTGNIEQRITPIAREIHHFIKIISAVAVFIGLLCFIILVFSPKEESIVLYILSFIIDFPWEYQLDRVLEHILKAFVFLVGIIVANVPEGLLATVTVCLSLTATKMKKENCLVKHLEAVETLGSTSTICSDKTGTLTQNKMTCMHLYYDRNIYQCTSLPMAMQTVCVDEARKTGTWEWLFRVACLCNKVNFLKDNIEENIPILQWKYVNGDASEAAILKAFELEVGGSLECREKYPKVAEIPFNSKNKYQISIHRQPNDINYLLVMKGAPEVVFNKCDKIMLNGNQEMMTEREEEFRIEFERSSLDLASKGERVLGFCYTILPQNQFPADYIFDTEEPNFPLDGYCFAGMFGLVDPPREGVKEAVDTCREAGINVVMVTGDHPATARAIARTVNIITTDGPTADEIAVEKDVSIFANSIQLEEIRSIVIHGSILAKMQAFELDYILNTFDEVVFSRTSPQQKLIIVEAYQRQGKIVAVTGDGVNDSPALKQANIGIAMGISGADVSKQAADMILMDDNFSSIVTGVKEGRLIFDNLKKSIAYTLTSNIPEITPFLLFILLKIPRPLDTIHILCIDLGTDLLPAISLAYEPAESEIMQRKPRNPKKDRLVNSRLIAMCYAQIGMLQAAAGFLTYFIIMGVNGFLPLCLFGISERWDNNDVNNLEDSYGVEWSYQARKQLEYTCNTGFFVSIVITQWADLLICKTRKNSIFLQRRINYWMIAGLIFETVLALFLTYTPVINHVLKMYPLRLEWLTLPLSFTVVIFCYDETRKWLLRKYPKGWVDRETYY
ncbi:Sodium/potassium-transporting ATPase subunit alpha-1 isoform X2 [Oopsacas minuta]|uniref:Sodium/potassium-transporting ATPase subunit alpha-1 isoform X2 n=1 Tax=Oopsacas minuta TaxID=111878 RepID=A0AAV7JS14_9METZ|nr:Sodium/potassium-transporting ATPase subunit alpha-1 isoform X2 [Oopsacas minuta]